MNGKSFFISVFILCCVIILGGNAFGDNGKKGKDGKHEYKGKSLKEWLEQIRGPKWTGRIEAVEALVKIKLPALPGLMKLGKDEKGPALVEVMRAIGRILGMTRNRPEGLELSAVYLNALNNKSAYVRRASVRGLSYLKGEEEFAAFKKAMNDKDVLVRRMTVQYFSYSKDLKREPLLMAVLKDKDSAVRSYAIGGLGKMRSRKAVPLLIKALKDTAEKVRHSAARALCKIGDRSAIPAIIGMLPSIDSSDARSVSRSIEKIYFTRNTVHVLTKGMKSENVAVRLYVLSKLGEINAKAYLPSYIEALDDKDADVRFLAVDLLGKLGDTSAVPALIKVLKDKDNYVRWRAVRALGKMRDKSAIPALIGMLKDKSVGVGLSSAESLENITKQSFGSNFVLWQKWWKENKDKIRKETAEKK